MPLFIKRHPSAGWRLSTVLGFPVFALAISLVGAEEAKKPCISSQEMQTVEWAKTSAG